MDGLHRPDKEVGKDLIKGTLLAGAFGATAGTVVGIMQQKPVPGYAFSGALNASLFGMTFVAFRESFLRFQRGKNPYFGLKDSQTMDIDQLWSSTVAGALTGGILSALARGAKAVPSGTFMFGVMGLGGQWILNKSNRYRQDTILAAENPLQPLPVTNTGAAGGGILNVLPVHRTDVDEYEARLKDRLQLIEHEERVLQEELQRRKKASSEHQ